MGLAEVVLSTQSLWAQLCILRGGEAIVSGHAAKSTGFFSFISKTLTAAMATTTVSWCSVAAARVVKAKGTMRDLRAWIPNA